MRPVIFAIAPQADLQSLATLLILHPTGVNTQMLQLTNSLNTFCGRGSDLGDANFSDVYAELTQDSYDPFIHVGQLVNRSKTLTTKGKHAAYPQRDPVNFMCSYVWGMCYLFVMCKESIMEHGKLFPYFAELCRNKKNGRIESRLSPIFNKLLDTIWIHMDDRFSASEEGAFLLILCVFIYPRITFTQCLCISRNTILC